MTNKNGGLFTYTHFNNKVVGIISLTCETDFAEKTDVFKQLGIELAMQVASTENINLVFPDFLNSESIVGDGTVQDMIESVSKQLKEKITIVDFNRFEFGKGLLACC